MALGRPLWRVDRIVARVQLRGCEPGKRKENSSKGFKHVRLNDTVGIWPWMSYVCPTEYPDPYLDKAVVSVALGRPLWRVDRIVARVQRRLPRMVRTLRQLELTETVC